MSFVAAAGAFLAVAALLRWAPDVAISPPRWLVGAVAIAAAAGALVAPGDPTGNGVVDGLARAALGATAALGAAVAPAAAIWAAGVAVAALVLTRVELGPAAGAAGGAAAAPLAVGTPAPLVSAIAAGLATNALLRLDWPLVTGASALLAAAGVAPLVVGAVRRLSPGAARRLATGVAVAAGVAVLASAAAGFATLSVADEVEAAVADAERGLDLLGDDDDAEEAEAALREAAAGFAAAEDRIDALWARPARLVPFVAQQARAVATMASAGEDLASAAADALAETDFDALRPVDGRVDLAAIARITEPLARAADALHRAEQNLAAVGSPWLLAPVATRFDDLMDRVVDAADDAETASLGAEVAPALLGADGPRRYLLLVQQLAEARGSGGLAGNYGEIVADDGELELVRFGRLEEIQPADGADRTLTGLEGVLGPYDEAFDLASYLQNTTAPPDFPTTAELFRQLYPQSGGSEVDGVVSVDPLGFAAVLDLTGPVTLEDGTTLDSSNAAEFLLHDQYGQFTVTEGDERADLLGDVALTTWEQLTTGPMDPPQVLGASLGDAARRGHIRFVSFDEREQQFFAAADLDGALPEPGPRTDGAGVVTQNLNGNKIDYFLRREVAYDVRWDPGSGVVDGNVRVRLTNGAPAAGEAKAVIEWGGTVDNPARTEPGENAQLVALYTRFPASEVLVDGEPVAGGFAADDHGWSVVAFIVRMPPGGSVEITATVAGELADGAEYVFVAPGQPAIDDPPVALDLTVDDGWAVAGVEGPAVGLGQEAIDGAEVAFGVRTLTSGAVTVAAERGGDSLLDRIRGYARR